MPIVSLNPDADRSGFVHADWTHTGGFATFWECIGPAFDGERMSHNGNYTGTEAEISIENANDVWDAYASFSEVRCRAVRARLWTSLSNPLSLLVVNVGIEYNPLVAATEVVETTIQHPGNTPLMTFDGPDFLELIYAIDGPWAEFKDDGTEWTRTDLAFMCLVFKGWQNSRVYTAAIDVILDLQALVNFGDPHFAGQQMGRFQRFSWRFNSRNEGFAQTKYHIKVYDEADFYFGIDPDVDTNQRVEALEESSNSWHDFHYKVGARLVPSFPPGTYYFCIKAARDFHGEDWWSPWVMIKFVIPDLGTSSITSPANPTTTSTRPEIEWTPSIDRRVNYSEVRIFQMPLDDDFDVDTTEDTPYYEAKIYGDVTSDYIQKSMENGDYRLYLRSFDQETDEWGDWFEHEWTQNVAQPPAPGLTLAPSASTSSSAVIATFYSGKLADNTVALQVKREAEGYPEEVVRILPNDVYDEYMNALPDGLRPVGIRVPGEIFSGIRLPNSTGLQPTTGLDVEVGVYKPDGWGTISGARSLAARWDGLGGDFRSWDFQLLTDRKLYLRWSTLGTGASVVSATSTVALPAFFSISEVYLRAQLVFASNYTVKFWYSTDQGETWTQLGADVVGVGATSIFDTTTHLYVDLGGNEALLGNMGVLVFSHFRLRSSVGGTIVAGAEFTGANEITPNPSTNMTLVGANSSYFYQIFGTDYEPPHNVPITYKARGVVHNTTNDELRYGPYDTESTELDNDTVWLKDLSDPTRNARFLSNQAWLQRETPKYRSARRPIGRDLPVIYKGAGRGEQFEFSFTCIGQSVVDNLIEILDGGGTLKLTTPKKSWYVEVAGNWTQSDHIFDERDGESDARIITVPFIEVVSPDVPSIA